MRLLSGFPIKVVEATNLKYTSRAFLSDVGIHGEVIHTPSHSKDSISLILDDGNLFVGDLEPFEYIEAYKENAALKNDWERILSFNPRRVFYAHRPEKVMGK